jgi:hypothetical protein
MSAKAGSYVQHVDAPLAGIPVDRPTLALVRRVAVAEGVSVQTLTTRLIVAHADAQGFLGGADGEQTDEVA